MSHPGGIRPIIDHQIDNSGETLGTTIDVIEAGVLVSGQHSLKDLRARGGQFDIVMHFPHCNGKLAAAGYLWSMDNVNENSQAGRLLENILDFS